MKTQGHVDGEAKSRDIRISSIILVELRGSTVQS
jgi:hypothetical protein